MHMLLAAMFISLIIQIYSLVNEIVRVAHHENIFNPVFVSMNMFSQLPKYFAALSQVKEWKCCSDNMLQH